MDEENQSPSGKRGDDSSDWYKLSGVGLEFIVAVLTFGFFGLWLDRRLGSTPWLMIVGFCIGFVAGLYILIRSARKMF